jgi:dynein light intermediate chain
MKRMQGSGMRLVVEGGAAAGAAAPLGRPRAPAGAHSAAAHLRQPPTSSPRLDAIILQDQLKREMRERQARYMGLCPVRERVYETIFDDLAAAVARDQPKRGALLRRLYGEARMSIDAYRTVFEGSTEFGSRKLTSATATKGGLDVTIEGLEGEIATLKAELANLTEWCEGLEAREAARNAVYDAGEAKEITDLKAEQEQLKLLIETLKPSKPKPSDKGK